MGKTTKRVRRKQSRLDSPLVSNSLLLMAFEEEIVATRSLSQLMGFGGELIRLHQLHATKVQEIRQEILRRLSMAETKEKK